MNANKKKLCWNCEGSVSRDAANCPYCGVYLHRSDYEKDSDTESEIEEKDDLAPPYQPIDQGDRSTPQPIYNPQPTQLSSKSNTLKQMETVSKSGANSTVLSLLFLLAGSLFLIFGIVLFLFARDGVFTLRWDGSYWFAYLIVAVPLLYLGWRALQKVNEE